LKKTLFILLIAILFTGCTPAPTVWETVADEPAQMVTAQSREILVDLPKEAAVHTMEADTGRLYLCQDYEIAIQTIQGGDLNATIRQLTGYEKEKLTVIETSHKELKRYDFAWSTAGENGDRVGRGVILDDGNYHYTMTVLHDAADTEKTQVVWRSVFESFTLG